MGPETLKRLTIYWEQVVTASWLITISCPVWWDSDSIHSVWSLWTFGPTTLERFTTIWATGNHMKLMAYSSNCWTLSKTLPKPTPTIMMWLKFSSVDSTQWLISRSASSVDQHTFEAETNNWPGPIRWLTANNVDFSKKWKRKKEQATVKKHRVTFSCITYSNKNSS